MVHRHILLLTFPAQGHLNPSLQFAKRLTGMGVEVTFATSQFAQRRLTKTAGAPKSINFAAISDGYDDNFKPDIVDVHRLASEMKAYGPHTLKQIILASAEEGRPVTCLVYTILLPWAAEVAREVHVPSALLWIQPATVLKIYYYYFNGYGDIIKNNSDSIQLPGLPVFSAGDLPSLLLEYSEHDFLLPMVKEHIDILHAEINPKVLVNTFDALEMEALTAVNELEFTGVGPLIPSAFLDGKDPTDAAFGGDLFGESKECMEWLDSNPEVSVVYLSFGSIMALPKPQMEEIGRALLETRRPFLWVVRGGERLSCVEELERQGVMVQWCPQLEVLSHPSLGCFVTHCGWNSTLESLGSGVPVVAFPHWTDQGTNAKLIADVWGTGVRVKKVSNEEGSIVESGEIKRCIDMVMGGEEIRMNAKKWKDLAREAMKEGGSSDKNLKNFVEELGKSVV